MDKVESKFQETFKTLRNYRSLKTLIRELNDMYGAEGWDFKMKKRDLEAVHFIKEGNKIRYFISDNVSNGLSLPQNLHRSMNLLIYSF